MFGEEGVIIIIILLFLVIYLLLLLFFYYYVLFIFFSYYYFNYYLLYYSAMMFIVDMVHFMEGANVTYSATKASESPSLDKGRPKTCYILSAHWTEAWRASHWMTIAKTQPTPQT